ncbi:hypothetical protein [Methanolapillus millepedarum]|uniref:Uncharacterized protein n=1 Tax=Methanolapillus millepedarum TaxID=3028296 RepID=A0AA96ZUV3_9EURY|nr:hypothetical protein MsAc7_16010 [Methanosarcinaceae archaeon Ac7]
MAFSFSDSKMAVLPFSELPVRYRINASPWQPKASDFESGVELAETLLEKAVGIYNEKASEDFVEFMAKNPASNWAQTDLFIELDKYYRQYIPFLNEKGEHCFWMNFFCRPVGNWKLHRVEVKAGGTCYFSIGFNIDTGKRFDFLVNGKE